MWKASDNWIGCSGEALSGCCELLLICYFHVSIKTVIPLIYNGPFLELFERKAVLYACDNKPKQIYFFLFQIYLWWLGYIYWGRWKILKHLFKFNFHTASIVEIEWRASCVILVVTKVVCFCGFVFGLSAYFNQS